MQVHKKGGADHNIQHRGGDVVDKVVLVLVYVRTVGMIYPPGPQPYFVS